MAKLKDVPVLIRVPPDMYRRIANLKIDAVISGKYKDQISIAEIVRLCILAGFEQVKKDIEKT